MTVRLGCHSPPHTPPDAHFSAQPSSGWRGWPISPTSRVEGLVFATFGLFKIFYLPSKISKNNTHVTVPAIRPPPKARAQLDES